MLVSIIMPMYNVERYVSLAINSVINQTFTNWELIIVDDGSTDTSGRIAKTFAGDDPRIKYFFQKNAKQAAARNLGIKHAIGHLIAFLDADDLWSRNKLDIQVRAFISSDIDVCFSGGHIIDTEGKRLSEYPTVFGHFTGKEIYKTMYSYNPIPVMAVLLKRSIVHQIGFQDESERMVGCEDFDYWLRIAICDGKFLGLNEKLFSYRINPHGTSRGILQMKIAECHALYKNFRPELFNKFEKKILRQRFMEFIKFIVIELCIAKRFSEVGYYFSLSGKITGSIKFKIASVFFKLFTFRSTKIVNYVLKGNV